MVEEKGPVDMEASHDISHLEPHTPMKLNKRKQNSQVFHLHVATM